MSQVNAINVDLGIRRAIDVALAEAGPGDGIYLSENEVDPTTTSVDFLPSSPASLPGRPCLEFGLTPFPIKIIATGSLGSRT